jgi:hypothetical protein
MARVFYVDITNTPRLIKRIFYVDITNTARQIKRAFYVDITNTPRLVFVAAQVIPEILGAVGTYPGTATCTIAFTTSGTETVQTNQLPTPSVVGNWAYPPTSSYQLMATLQSGTAPTGNALNVWIPVTGTLSWSLTRFGPGSSTCSLLIQISTNSSSVIASGVITMTSTVESGG